MEVPSLLHQSFKKCVNSNINLKDLNRISLPVFVEVKTLFVFDAFISLGIVFDEYRFRRKEKQCLCITQNNKTYYYDPEICPPLVPQFDTPQENNYYKKVIYDGQTKVQRKN
uniref:NS3 n=1 Tax=Culex pipiens densovirus TaxID=185638 RepID=A0A7D3P7I8_9VIRU|nr:NS3 [Culex pipiens densovirus]